MLLPLPCPQVATQGQTWPSLRFLPKNELTSPPKGEGPGFVYLGFSPAEKPDAFPKRKPGSFYPKAFLGMSRRLTLPTTSSHGPIKACFRLRWAPTTLSLKWHTALHRVGFYFTVSGFFGQNPFHCFCPSIFEVFCPSQINK